MDRRQRRESVIARHAHAAALLSWNSGARPCVVKVMRYVQPGNDTRPRRSAE